MAGYPDYQAQTQANLTRVSTQLDALVDITGTQNQIAGQLGHELTAQNKMIANLSDHMDGTQGGIQKATDAVKEVKTSGSTWFAWILVILLIIAIILVFVLWPKN
jgi:t-SNARE complex subunit (syntaxin)